MKTNYSLIKRGWSMIKKSDFKAALILIISVIFLLSLQAASKAEAKQTGEVKDNPGKKIYEERCLVCHGRKGDGKGPASLMKRSEKSGRILEIKPRDFTLGAFRFRSTPTGCLPTEADLILLVDKGIPRSFMPPHKDQLTKEQKKAVVEYVKTFSTRWKEEEPCKPVVVRKPKWVGSKSSVEKGKKLYKDMKCWECHGDTGKGDGPKADLQKDDWGNKILAFDFTTGATKMGSDPENVYTAYTTGLDGAGMPSYEDSMSEADRWHLVSYTLKLMGKVK